MAMAQTLKDNIFKNKGVVPPSILRLLMVRNGGADITDRLAHWKSKTSDTPYAVPVITVTNTTGKITASRVVTRGPMFSAADTNRVPATHIWASAREDLEVSFLLDGSALTFNSDEAPNVSDWIDMRTIAGFKVTDKTSGAELSQEELEDEEGVQAGACARVALQIHNIHYLAATFQVRISWKKYIQRGKSQVANNRWLHLYISKHETNNPMLIFTPGRPP